MVKVGTPRPDCWHCFTFTDVDLEPIRKTIREPIVFLAMVPEHERL